MSSINKVKLQYSEWAKTYEKDKINLFKKDGIDYDEFMNRFFTFCELKPDSNILDIGIGTGLTSIFLAKKLNNKCKIIGIDPSEEMIRIAENNLYKEDMEKIITIKKARGERLPFDKTYFDLIVSTFVFRHMKIEHVLKEIKRVLKDHGRVVIADICAPRKWRTGFGRIISFIVKKIIITKNKYKAESKSQVLTIKEWEELFRIFGFKIDRFAEFPSKKDPEWKPKRVIFVIKKIKDKVMWYKV